MPVTTQTSLPASVTVGDTTRWSEAHSGYTPGTDTLVAGFSGPTRFTLTATVDPDDADKFLFTIAPATNIAAGEYLVVIRATDTDGNVETLTTTTLTALPQVGATHAVLDALEAKLVVAEAAYHALAIKTKSSVSVDGVSYTNATIDGLRRYVSELKRLIAAEKNSITGLHGNGFSGLYVTRFRN